jgi:hypothetical protein
MAHQTSIYPWQKENTVIMGSSVSALSMPRCNKQGQLAVTFGQRTAEVLLL